LVGTPFSAIILGTMGTPAGFAAYRNEKINNIFKKILKEWTKFLNSKKSLYVLNTSKNGWMSKDAMKKLKMDSYKYDSKKKHWGFISWNDFFTRKLKPGARPIMGMNDKKIIVSACDSTIYKIKSNVQKYSKFWIKKQPYSIADMLNYDKYVDNFVGGHVFQAFLNPFNYHRWHSPVSGTILKAYVKEGLYFSQDTVMGENKTDQDLSQGYITQVQTRAIFYIKSDNPSIGIVAVMPVGMVEISSCIIHKKIKRGYKIKKGEELGYFQFGGSSHCLFFEKTIGN
jgi:phosphatidylserine decarboxylase